MAAYEESAPASFAFLEHKTLEHGLSVLLAEPPLDPYAIDTSLKNPEKFRAELGGTLQLVHGIEDRVDTQFAPSLLKLHSNHPVFSVSTPVWNEHETAHAKIWESVLHAADVPPLVGRKITGEISHYRVVKVLSMLFSDVKGTAEWVTAFYGELNEFMTGRAYTEFGKKALALGERAIHDISQRIIIQEGKHLGVYAPLRKWIERDMGYVEGSRKVPVPLWLGRKIVEKGMRIVGTEDFGPEAIGHMLIELVSDTPDELRDKVQKRARIMLENPDDTTFEDFYDRTLKAVASKKFASA